MTDKWECPHCNENIEAVRADMVQTMEQIAAILEAFIERNRGE